MEKCKICSGNFHDSPDKLVLCEHKAGMVHMGCCTHNCSMDHNPCKNCKSVYQKMNM